MRPRLWTRDDTDSVFLGYWWAFTVYLWILVVANVYDHDGSRWRLAIGAMGTVLSTYYMINHTIEHVTTRRKRT